MGRGAAGWFGCAASRGATSDLPESTGGGLAYGLAASIGIEGNAFVLDVVPLIDGRVLVTEMTNATTQNLAAELFVP